LAEAIDARRKALVESDSDAQPTKVITHRLKDEVDAVRDALGTLDRRITETEARIGAERDKREREQEAARRKEQIATARLALDKLTAAAEEAVTALQPLIGVSLGVGAAASSVKLLGEQAKHSTVTGLFEVEN
jgi:hypothetical protein